MTWPVVWLKKAAAEDFDVYLYTSDHDYFQLIDDTSASNLLKKA